MTRNQFLFDFLSAWVRMSKDVEKSKAQMINELGLFEEADINTVNKLGTVFETMLEFDIAF